VTNCTKAVRTTRQILRGTTIVSALRPDMTGLADRPLVAISLTDGPGAGAWEVSTWSTRSAASMNDVDTDERRLMMGRQGMASRFLG
jgi:hypothetical protein